MPSRPSCNIHRVCRLVGVKLRPPAEHSPTMVRPKHCFCPSTLRAIGLEHGEAHLRLVLRLIVETRGNASELHAATIRAVSNVLSTGLVEASGALFDAFDGIDLGVLRLWAQAARSASQRASVADAMTSALLWQLASPDKLQVAA